MYKNSTKPIILDTSPEESMYQGLSHQNLDFHQALAELIDNAISAQNHDFFSIEVHLTRVNEFVDIMVADNGTGISLNDLQYRVMRLGGKGEKTGRLNEHGYGLKNSLCRLTENKLGWEILTRSAEAPQDIWFSVPGPFRSGMVAMFDDGSRWNRDILKSNGETGTRVFVRTTFEYFRTLYKRLNHFDERMIERLHEHLGVIYRGYLLDRRNTLWIRWRSDPKDAWSDFSVQPIEIPYAESKTKDIKVKFGSKESNVKYEWGYIDEEKRDHHTGSPYPLKIYYQANMRTQGIDIRFRGRVVNAHAFTEIWDLERDNHFNYFTGELIIDSDNFSSVNNKTTLDEQNPFWQALRVSLNDSEFEPDEFKHIRRQDEEAIKEMLRKQLPNIVNGSKVTPDLVTWAGMGVKIDLLHTMPNGETHIYEIKARELSPQDVYQLVMYWDGRVRDGFLPTLGRLVGVSDPPTSVTQMLEYWNRRKDANGNNYKFDTKTSRELLGDIAPSKHALSSRMKRK
ncbi:MAG: sensor histidine kinase [Dehalococcoidales bacterium]|nr:sensor histidine kinase [Dehalococcoidales bacterium]